MTAAEAKISNPVFSNNELEFPDKIFADK